MQDIHSPTNSDLIDTKPARGKRRRFVSFVDMNADKYRYW